MLRFVLRRLAAAVLLVFALLTLVFFIVHLLPGDPVVRMLGDEADPAVVAALRHQLRLDRPIAEQYALWIGDVLRGDLGTSFTTRRPVTEMLGQVLPNTLLLTGLALILRFLIGIGVGTLAALRHGRLEDRTLVLAAVVLYSVPAFWLGVMLQLVFAHDLRWLPPDSMHALDAARWPLGRRAVDLARHLVLPVVVLALPGVASTARYMRASLLEVLSQDYVRAARARGLGARAVVLRHALRNALPPIATLLGLALPALVGGSLIVENIFSWPGMGRLALRSVSTRDTPVLLAATTLSAVLVVLGSLFADIVVGWLDPRQRLGRGTA